MAVSKGNNVYPLGGSGGGDMFEARVARLESDVDYIKRDLSELKQDFRGLRADMRTDFRIVWAGFFASTLGLAGLMAKGFGWI